MVDAEPADMEWETVINVMGFDIFGFAADFAWRTNDGMPFEILVKSPPGAFFRCHRGYSGMAVAMESKSYVTVTEQKFHVENPYIRL